MNLQQLPSNHEPAGRLTPTLPPLHEDASLDQTGSPPGSHLDGSSEETLEPQLLEQSMREQETRVEATQTNTSDAEALTALLQQEAKLRKRDEVFLFFFIATYTLVLTFIAEQTVYSIPERMFQLRACFGLMVLLGALLSGHLWRRSYRRKHKLSQELEKPQSLQTVGLLIETLRVENTTVRNLAKQSLIKLLPTMQASDAECLSETHRDRLIRLLTISPNDRGYYDVKELFSRSAKQREIDLRLSVLKALEQVGGAKELPVVERLSRGLPTLQSQVKTPDVVRDAADACLPFLQARASEQRASEQLLRASSLHATANNLLLRPAENRSDILPEQLLRASKECAGESI